MAEPYYPPGAFYFSVNIIGVLGVSSLITSIDNSFEEVSGIQAEFDIEEIAEGGENRFKHRLPSQAKYSNLVLKRGVVTIDSFLAEWCGETIGANLATPIVTQNLLVTLLDAKGIPTTAWGFSNAWPVKWEIGNMNSQENKILTETLAFSYNFFERVNLTALGGAAKIAKLISKL
jgi:phage tail-like protein